MDWRIEFAPEAAKEFGKLGGTAQRLIRDYLRTRLCQAENPRSFGKALSGDKAGLWRYRVEKYRIICKIEDHALIILIVRIGKRDKVYG
jgi:mRNA interferase RelE/StbE